MPRRKGTRFTANDIKASMAAKSSQEQSSTSNTAIKERTTDLTECSICTEPFDKPKCLPCIHTFCLKCLKEYGKSYKAGSQIPCPLCRQMFTIPTAGFEGLSTNFFVEHLMTINSLDSNSNAKTICDYCSDDDSENASATGYCIECRLNLCVKCSARHKKQPFAKTHNIVTIKEKQTSKNLTKLHTTYCEKHAEEQLKLFCYTCKAAVCLMCLAINHNGHNCSDINEAGETFRKQLEGQNLSQLNSCIAETEGELKKLDTETPQVLRQIVSAKQMIKRKSNELKSSIDFEEKLLNEQLNSFKEKRLKQIEGRRADLNMQLATTKSFIEYSNKLLENGSACDISRSANDIISRKDQLVTSQSKFNKAKLLEFNVSYGQTILNQGFHQLNTTPLLSMVTMNGKQVTASESKRSAEDCLSSKTQVCPYGCQQPAPKASPFGYNQQSYNLLCPHGAYRTQCHQCRTVPEECSHGYELSACPNDSIREVQRCAHGLRVNVPPANR